MSRATIRVVNDVLLLDGSPVIVGQDSWFEWLDTASSFSYEAAVGSFNARKERRKNGQYWKAYRRLNGVLRSVYLGKSRELISVRLAEAAWRLGPRARAKGADAYVGRLPAAKLAPPPPDGRRVPRPRLFGRLGVEADPLILVSAPAGCGKTAAVADWIRAEGRAAAWISLDKKEDAPAPFWTAVALALESAWPGAGSPALSSLLESGLPPEEAFPSLLNGLRAELKPDASGRQAVLVLDDYHAIRNVAVHGSLRGFLELLPPHLRVAVLSRDPPPPAFSRLRAGGRVTELGAADLAFDRDETAALMALAAGRPLEEDELGLIEERDEGWAAALALTARSITAGGGHRSPHRGDEEPLYGFFAEEILSRQGEEARSFLLRGSVLERLSPGLCDSVMGFPEGEGRGDELIRRMAVSRLLLPAPDDESGWHRQPRLLSEALLRRLRTERPGEERGLRERAARWLDGNGLHREAWSQWMAVRDYAEAARAVEKMAVAFCERGDFTALGTLIASMPRDVIQERPTLSLVLAVIKLLHGEEEGMESLFGGIESGLEDGSVEQVDGVEPELSPQAIKAWITAARAISIGGLRRNLPAARRRVKEALAEIASGGGRLYPLARLIYGSVLIFCDAVAEADQAYAEAAADAPEGGYARYAALLNRACMAFERGRLSEAERLAGAVLASMERGGAEDMAIRGMGDVVLGIVAYERGNLEAAERAALQALGCIRGASGSRQRERASILLARIRMARGDRAGAVSVIESVLSEEGSANRLSRPSLGAWRLRFILSSHWKRAQTAGRAEASAWLEEVERGLDPAGLPIVHYSSRELLPMMARARLFLGDAEEALAILDAALRRAADAGAIDLEVELRAIHALALDAAGRTGESISSLQTALSIGRAEGYVRSFTDEGPAMASLLRRARTRLYAPCRLYAATILTAMAGGRFASDGAPGLTGTAVSPSEEAVLSLAAQGCSNADIAQALFIAESTVKAHLGSVYRKLGAENRVAAIATARKLGILR